MRNFIALVILFGFNLKAAVGQSTYADELKAGIKVFANIAAPAYFESWGSDTASLDNFAGDYLRLREVWYRPNMIAKLTKQGGQKSANGGTSANKLKPVTLPEPGFQQYFARRIFNGDFQWLRSETREQELIGPDGYKTITQMYHINPYFADLYIMYVTLANRYYGKNQLHSTTSLRIDKTITTKQYGFVQNIETKKGEPFWIDDTLEPMYTDLFNQCSRTNILMRNEFNFEPRLLLLGKEMENFIQQHAATSPETAQLLENMMRYYKGGKSIQEEIAATNKLSNDDRFFPPAFYEANPFKREQYAGGTIKKEWAGRFVSWKELSVIALEKLIQTAAQNKIPEKDITKAIFEGRLNPEPLDLDLAFEGFCTNLRVSDIPADIMDDVKKNNNMDAQDTIPHYIYLMKVYYLKQLEGWNKRFGSIQSLTNVTTIYRRKSIVCNGNDILFRLFLRYTGNPEDFKQAYGFTPTPEMTYEEALKLAVAAGSRVIQDRNTVQPGVRRDRKIN